MITEETIYRGDWWLPADEADKQPGALVITPNGHPRLELIRGFEDGRDAVSLADTGSYPVIFGVCGEVCFTVLRAHTQSGDDRLMGATRNHIITANRAIKGDRFLVGEGELAVTSVSTRIDHLINFAGLTGFGWNDAPGWEVDEVSSSASYTLRPELRASWNGVDFTLGLARSDFCVRQHSPDVQELSAIEHAYLDIDFPRPVTLPEADDYVSRLEDLLTIALARPCAVRNTRYQFTMHEPTTEVEKRRAELRTKYHIETFGRRIFPPDRDPYEPLRGGIHFTLRDLPFEQVIPTWMDIYNRAETGIQMLCGTWYMDGGYVSTQLMNVCAAMESIHTGLYDRPRMPEAEWTALERQAMSGVERSSDRETLHQLLNNRMFFKQRALELAQKLGHEAGPELLGDVEMWAKLATTRRNAAAHALRPGEQDGLPGRDLFLFMVTRMLLCLVLVRELGLDGDKFGRAVQQAWPVSSRWKEVMKEA